MSALVLVTGAGGLLGGVLAKALGGEGREILATVRRPGVEVPGLECLPCELSDPEAVQQLFTGRSIGAVVHVAGRIRGEPGATGTFVRDNVVATTNLLDASRAAGVERFVFCSTISVYSGEGPFAESSPTAVSDPYGWTKRKAEELCLQSAAGGPSIVVLRFAGLHGHPRRDGVIHAFFASASRGEPLRIDEPDTEITPTFLDDVVGVMRRILERPVPQSASIFNVAIAEAVTLRQLAEAIHAQVGGGKIELVASAKRRNRALETNRLRTDLGYQPLPLSDHLARFSKKTVGK